MVRGDRRRAVPVHHAGTGTAEEMSDWVEYCDLAAGGRWSELRAANGHPEPFAVPFWSIGNENYGDWEMGAKIPRNGPAWCGSRPR